MLPSLALLGSLAWKASVVLVLAHALAMLLRRRSAAERHLLWTAAAVSLLMLPALERSTPPMVVLEASIVQPATQAPPVQTVETSRGWSDYAAPLWAAGFLAIITWQMAGLLLLASYRQRRVPAAAAEALLPRLAGILGLRPGVRVYTNSRVSLPMTWGVFHPVILLPESASEWTTDRMRVVLIHELAHVRRFDFLTQLLAGVARAVYWFHPLAWTAVSAMRREREKACDDTVLTLGVEPAGYATHLLDIAAAGSARPVPASAVPMAQASHLETRIRAALNPSVSRQNPRRVRKAAFAFFSALAVAALVVVKIQAQADYGKLYGAVLDASGAAVPKAVVTVALAGGQRKEITRGGEDGAYAFVMLPAGSYTVEVRKPGFALLSRKDLQLKAGEARQLDLTLEIGRIQETVEVVGKGSTPPPPLASGSPHRIRVGGNVQATKLLYMAKPAYPETLQQQGIEGTVLLEGVISVDGSLLSLRSLNSLVHPELTKAAMDAVKQWRYQPTLLNGKPVEVVTTITVNYRLEK
ncbi:MAG: TonB family protein [Bryobacterales bacterium]|nr:TonB family protein [Bryobacterales bacterium]